MQNFLSRVELQDAISEIMKQTAAKCAVAFWGSGAENVLVGKKAKVICNLKSGGTNPFVIEKLKNAEIRQCDVLHAKVYIGAKHAIVASANASANGLGFEGDEQSSWLEAGVRVDHLAPLEEWFDSIWNHHSRLITSHDLASAKKAWMNRQRYKPTLPTFADFDTNGATLPLLTWIGDDDWEPCVENVRAQLGNFNQEIEQRIDDGIQIDAPEDEPLLMDRWVLCWRRGKNGLPLKRPKPQWVHLSKVVVRGAFRYRGEKIPRDSVLASEDVIPVPFDINESKFISVLRIVLENDTYKAFTDGDYEGSWFAARQNLVPSFWRDMKVEYLKTTT